MYQAVGNRYIPSTTLAQLHSEYPHVCAIKEASGNLMIASEIKRLIPGDRFHGISGDDGLTLPMLSVGMWCSIRSIPCGWQRYECNDSPMKGAENVGKHDRIRKSR